MYQAALAVVPAYRHCAGTTKVVMVEPYVEGMFPYGISTPTKRVVPSTRTAGRLSSRNDGPQLPTSQGGGVSAPEPAVHWR
jgi:hypothetical protein